MLYLAIASVVMLVAFFAFRAARRKRELAYANSYGTRQKVSPLWSLLEKHQTYPGVSAEENARLRADAYYAEQNAIYQKRRAAIPGNRGKPYVALDGWQRDSSGKIIGMIQPPASWEPSA